MTQKKKIIIGAIITAVLIAALVIALLCLGGKPAASTPDATAPTISTDPTAAPTEGSTTPPTGGNQPATDPSDPADPTQTEDPSAPTDATDPTGTSAPATGSTTVNPTQAPTQKPTQKPTQAATQKPTQPATQKPTQAATQATTPGVQLKITTPDDTVIYPGDTLQLEYIYTGNKKLTWSNSFDDIFTVDQNGLVTATGGGSTIVKVTDGDITSRIYITVQSITVNTPAHTAISVGETMKIDYKYLGKPQPMTWTSSDPDVLTVDKNGVVTGVSTGVSTVTVEDKHYMQRLCIYVVADEDRTTSMKLVLNAPLYDGVNKIVGNYVQIGQLNSVLRNDSGERNNIVDEWHAAGRQSDPSTPDPFYPCRNYYITSSNPDVISVENKFDEGFYDDFLYFNKPGKSTITVTSWDGYSESYTINVKAEYDCAPKKEKLTPGEFAYYATMVGVEDGQVPAYQLSSYLYIWYTEDELTWEEAKKLGHANSKREFFLNSPSTIIFYAGIDENNGMHLFYHGMGSSNNSQIAPYTPAKASSGKLRFPSNSISIMEKTLKVVEVLGDTGGADVTYTSSNPSVVLASGSMLIPQHPGTAVITATCKGQTATITVNVTANPDIERVIFEQDTCTIPLNSSAKLKYTYNGTSELKWESSDESIAYVDIMGTVVPVGIGECTIRLRSVDNPILVVDGCKIIVTDPIKYPDATDIIFRSTSDKLSDCMVTTVGEGFIIDAYTIPTDSRTEVRCDSSNYDVIYPGFGWNSDLGRNVYTLICYEPGNVTITLSSSDGCVSKTYTITVKERT